MRRANNFFEKEWIDGQFEIRGGRLLTEGWARDGELLYVGGSSADGLVAAGENGVYERDEVFEGRVWICRPTRGFIRACEKLEAEEREREKAGAIVKERFGDYSCERADAAERRKHVDAVLRPWIRMFCPVG